MPAAAVPALTVSVELPPAVTEVGLRLADAPAGVPDTVRATVSALPEVTVVEMVLVPCAPAPRVKLVGFAEIEKSLLATPPQPGNLKEAMRVRQLKLVVPAG